MTYKQKFDKFLKKKNLTTTNNRKKVGILFFLTTIALFFLFVLRLGYIVLVGNVGDVSLKQRTTELYKGSEVIAAKRGTIYDRNGIAIAEDTCVDVLQTVFTVEVC